MTPAEAAERLDEALAKVPRRELGQWPTPLSPMKGLPGGWVKREDKANDLYGGNKVRKLEYLLGDPATEAAKVIISLGGIGSHHLEALAVHKLPHQELIGVLFPQPATREVWHTLGALLERGVTLVGTRSETEMATTALSLYARETLKGNNPSLILPGGSTPLGCLGWVRAGVEVARQIEQQDVGDVVAHVAPAGSLGTVVGLRVGLALAGQNTTVVAVGVAPPGFANRTAVEVLTGGVAMKLLSLGLTPPRLDRVKLDFDTGYLGAGYGHPTEKAQDAARQARKLLSMGLDGTYSAKAFACFLDRFDGGLPKGQAAIFYQTYNQTLQPTMTEDEVRQSLADNPAVQAGLAMET